MDTSTRQLCFLLTHSNRDSGQRFELTLFAKSQAGRVVKIIIDNARPLFFIPRTTPALPAIICAERKSLPLRSLDGSDVDCLYFRTYGSCREVARLLRAGGICLYESDIHPAERFLMERFVKGGFEAVGPSVDRGRFIEMRNPSIRGARCEVELHVLSLDIETNAASGAIYSIAAVGKKQRVFMIDAGEACGGDVVSCPNEKELLRCFLTYIAEEDPDVLIGWNIVSFDLLRLQERCRALCVPFTLGREGMARVFRPPEKSERWVARVPGRVVLDGPAMLRAQFHIFDDYSLDHVAMRMLGKHKELSLKGREKIEEIDRLFTHDKQRLAQYNLTDALLVREIFEAASIIPNAIERSRRSGLLLDRVGGSVAAFDYLYLPLLHRAGRVAKDIADVVASPQPLPGGYVIEPRPGIYEHVLLFDFKSLYPSIIRTFMIDPLGMVSLSNNRVVGPVGPSFARDESILPRIIAELMAARAEAKRSGNTSLSLAIKILMNSFYGVLGTTACRFFSYELASAITGIGQFILKKTASHLEQVTGCAVVYGDTDSLFLLRGGDNPPQQNTGPRIATDVTAWLAAELQRDFGVVSALELQFEKHFRFFLLPSLRGTQQGSKKRYCGAIEHGDGTLDLEFKGMESARSDWTEIARECQRELCLRLFTGRPVEEYILSLVNAIWRGRLDSKLVYRKRLNKPLSQYTGALPPHVQAARLLDQPAGTIAYVMTRDGPQPLEKRTAPLDYQHYVDAQIRPVADAILEWMGTSFEKIVSGQQELFATP